VPLPDPPLPGPVPIPGPDPLEPPDPHDPLVHTREQQSPKVPQVAPSPAHVVPVPPQTPAVQSLLQHSAEELHVLPSALQVGATQVPEAQFPLQHCDALEQIWPAGRQVVAGARQTPEHDSLQQSCHVVQVVPGILHAPTPPPSPGMRPELLLPEQLRTATVATTLSADHATRFVPIPPT
jgi:hypothetical protein